MSIQFFIVITAISVLEILSGLWRHRQDPFYYFDWKKLACRLTLVFLAATSIYTANYLTQIKFLKFGAWEYYTTLTSLFLALLRTTYNTTSIYTIVDSKSFIDLAVSIFALVFKLDTSNIKKWVKEHLDIISRVRDSARFTWSLKKEIKRAEKMIINTSNKLKEEAKSMPVKELKELDQCKNKFENIFENTRKRVYFSDMEEQLKDNFDLVMSQTIDDLYKKMDVIFNSLDSIQERRYALENEILFFKQKVLYLFKEQLLISGDNIE